MSAGPQRILITGAGSGIGRALLERHANQGDNCAVMVRDDAEARADAVRSAALLASIPLGRYGSAGEVAATISFLLSDAASFTTGQILCVDGGATAA